MAVMPGVHFLNAVQDTVMARYDIVCVHTIVGHPPANAAHFSTRADGYIWQSRDTRYRSAANYNGNPRVIAIENEDMGPVYGAWNTNDGHQVPGFTAQQVEAIAQICAWVNRVHGIPLVLCPDSKPGSRGIGYHREGIDSPTGFAGYQYGGRVPGGEVWTTSPGKVCPGDRRITQLVTQIIPRARQVAGLDVPASLDHEDDTMIAFFKGDSDAKDEKGTRYGDRVYLVKFDPELDGGAVRSYVGNSSVFAMGSKIRPVIQVPQAQLDSIPKTPDSL